MEERRTDAIISKIMVGLLMISIVVACSIQKLLDPVLHVEVNEKIWLLGLELLILLLLCFNKSLLQHWKEIKWIWVISGMACVLIASGAYKSMILNGMPLRTTVFYSVPYFYALLSIPIALLLIHGDLKLERLLQWIVFWSMVSYGIRIFISWYYGKTGVMLFPSIALEGAAADWIRNGISRLNPPVFVSLLLPGIAYLFMKSTEYWKRILHVLSAVVILYFTFRIHQARAFMVYQVLTLVVIWLTSRKKITWKEWALLAVVAVLVMRTQKFQEFVFSLSLKNTGETATTGVRIDAIKYFGEQFLKSPLLGVGYLDGEAAWAVGWGHIADIGVLQTVFTMGLCGVLYAGSIMAVSCGAYIMTLGDKTQAFKRCFLISLAVAFFAYNFNMDMFSGYLAYAMPFYLAFMKKA